MAFFTELRTHSAFSFGDGAVTPETLARRAAVLGYESLGLTDAADLGGGVRFVLEDQRHGRRRMAAPELLVAPDLPASDPGNPGRTTAYPAAFLAIDERGYRNLAGLVTRARVGDLDTSR